MSFRANALNSRGIVGADPSAVRTDGHRDFRPSRFVAAWGHDKIGATAYANLDKKGT
jgi:hypothetical protein